MNPFFSIILPTYNRAHLIEKTVDHILSQTFKDFELIIIDDASTDKTLEVLNAIQDSRVMVLKNEVNLERSRSRNKGIDHAKGEWIAFCDSDDHWRTHHLEVMYKAIHARNEQSGLYFTQMTWNFPDRIEEVYFPEITSTTNQVTYLIEHQIGTPCVCISASILKEHQFNPAFSLNEDVDLYAKIAASFPIFKVDHNTVDVQIHSSNTQNLVNNPLQPQIEVFRHLIETEPTKTKIPKEYAKNRMAQLKHQQINFLLNQNDGSVCGHILDHLLRYPAYPGQKAKIVGFLYNMPGGKLIKKFVRSWKRK